MEQKLSVAHFLASNFFGGPEKQLLEHVQRLDKQRFTSQVISFDEGGTTNQLLAKTHASGIRADKIDTTGAFDPRMVINLLSVIKAQKIDLLCVHGYKANVIGRIAAWLSGIPVIAISRGWTGEAPKIRFYEWLDKLFLRFADHIVAVSHGQMEKIAKLGIPPEHVSVIHNCIAVPESCYEQRKPFLRRELGLPDAAVLVVSAGRLSPEKNYGGMIEVARVVAASNPEVYFIIFGEGFLRPDLERAIDNAGLAGRFLLPGFRNDLQAVLPEVDIFMLPSFTEGLPNVILEAFAVRKPVVATRVGGTPEVVEHGVSGFLAEPHETEVMAQYVLRLAGDPALRREMGAKGLEHVITNFGFEQQTIQYENLYRQIAGSGRRA